MNRQLNTISISCNLLYEAMAYKKFAKAMAMSVLIKNKVTSSTVVGYTKKELCNITDCDFRTVKKHLKILREYGMVREEKIKKRKDITFLSLKDKKAEKNISMENLGINTLEDAENHVYMLCFKMIIERKRWVKRQLFLSHNFKQSETGKEARRMCRKYGLNRHENDQYIDYGISIATISKMLGIGREKTQKIVNMADKNRVVIKKKRIVKTTPEHYNQMCKYVTEEVGHGNTFVSRRCNVFKVYANIYYVPLPEKAEADTTMEKTWTDLPKNNTEKAQIGGENPQNGRENRVKTA